MKVLRPYEPFSDIPFPSIFLAGPTPRSPDVKSWRPEAIDVFATRGFTGTLFVPEPADGKFSLDYTEQAEWEEEGLCLAHCIMFWVPRHLPDMPAFTTNDEWGVWKASGKVVFGAPPDAEKVKYQWYYAKKLGVPRAETLKGTIENALTFCRHFV